MSEKQHFIYMLLICCLFLVLGSEQFSGDFTKFAESYFMESIWGCLFAKITRFRTQISLHISAEM